MDDMCGRNIRWPYRRYVTLSWHLSIELSQAEEYYHYFRRVWILSWNKFWTLFWGETGMESVTWHLPSVMKIKFTVQQLYPRTDQTGCTVKQVEYDIIVVNRFFIRSMLTTSSAILPPYAYSWVLIHTSSFLQFQVAFWYRCTRQT